MAKVVSGGSHAARRKCEGAMDDFSLHGLLALDAANGKLGHSPINQASVVQKLGC